jgi:hypothetical protein
MQLLSGRHEHDPAKDRAHTTHFIITVARAVKIAIAHPTPRSAYVGGVIQYTHCNVSAASASVTRSATADTRLRASLVVTPISPAVALPLGNSYSAMVAG